MRPADGEPWQTAARPALEALERAAPKEAVGLAKELHKHWQSQESGRLLADSYLARIEELRRGGLCREAETLLDVAASKLPEHRDDWQGERALFAVRRGDLDAAVAPLTHADSSPHLRQAIERALFRELSDPSKLAACTALPEAHPLRVGAAAIADAFASVTRGPVEESALALPEISRRSPLSPWKTLVTAMACFYNGDHQRARALLDRLDSASSPARLAPALRALLGEGSMELSPAATRLVRSVRGQSEKTNQVLERLDRHLRRGPLRKVGGEIRKAVEHVQSTCPELLEAVKQRISILAYSRSFNRRTVALAIGEPVRRDAQFWLFLARAVELGIDSHDHGLAPLEACAVWDEFRRHALAEGRFAAKGPEEAALYHRMLGLLELYADDDLPPARRQFEATFDGFSSYYEGQPPPIAKLRRSDRNFDFLDAYMLYSRAAEAAPDRDTFARWLAHCQRRSLPWQKTDPVAAAWHDAHPRDTRPLLALVASTEKRNALSKAIFYLERAESLDPLSSEVRRARVRLLVAKALRHLQNGNARLMGRDLEELDATEMMHDSGHVAVSRMLRWAHGLLSDDVALAREQAGLVVETVGNPTAARVLLEGLWEQSGRGPARELPQTAPLEAGELVASVGKPMAAAAELGLVLSLKPEWRAALQADLRAERTDLDSASVAALAEVALDAGQPELAFSASSLGLDLDTDNRARWLLVRARCLPDFDRDRRLDAAMAAAAVARQHRRLDLVEAAVDYAHQVAGRRSYADLMDADDAQEVLEYELDNGEQYPTKPSFGYGGLRCDCPACRAARRRGDSGVPVLEEDDWDDDDGWDEVLGGLQDQGMDAMPFDVLKVYAQLMVRYGADLPPPDVVAVEEPRLFAELRRVLGAVGLGEPGPSKTRKKKGRQIPLFDDSEAPF
jgi:hypothetical protein